MRHGKKINHLSRKSAHRKAMLSNMACSLIQYKRINTTLAKAKALRKYVEPLITKSKSDTTHSRRIVFSYLQNKDAASTLFREVAPKINDRPGGYTRIIKLNNRLGDNAQMAMIELVDFNELLLTEKAAKKKTRRRGGKKKTTDSVTSTSTIEEVQEAGESKTEEVEAEVVEKAPVVEESTTEEVKAEVVEEEPVVEESTTEEVKAEVVEEAPVVEESTTEEVKAEVVEEAPVAEESTTEEVKAEADEEAPEAEEESEEQKNNEDSDKEEENEKKE